MKKKVKPIETERLVLCEIEEEDTPLIVQWRSVPEVYQYFFSPKAVTEAEHLEWFFHTYMKDSNRIDFMAIEKASEKKIGIFNIRRKTEDVQCSEIGYLLDKGSQGKGYAQEGVKRLMLFARERWECKKAILNIHEENIASHILASKLGYEEKSRKDKFVLYDKILVNIYGGGYWRSKIRCHILGAGMHQVAA